MAGHGCYNGQVDEPGWLAENYPQLQGRVYLDHAGAALYSKPQVEAYQQRLLSNLYGNPHSAHSAGLASSELVQEVRAQVLRYCQVSSGTHHVIFTRSATEALALLAECWPVVAEAASASTGQPTFTYVTHNHTSVVGLREALAAKGYRVQALKPAQVQPWLSDSHSTASASGALSAPHLFAYSAQCNLSGRRFPWAWASAARALPTPTLVLLDIASYSSTARPDLRDVDFAPMSFYKLFGLATGAGALIVSQRALEMIDLRSRYFGGGTVAAYSATKLDFRQDRTAVSERLERGTLPFMELAAVVDGFRQRLLPLALSQLQDHVLAVTQYTIEQLTALPAVRLLSAEGQMDSNIPAQQAAPVIHGDSQGPILAFVVRRQAEDVGGSDSAAPAAAHLYASPHEVAALAAAHGIMVRAGCQCNVGACHELVGVSEEEHLSAVAQGHRCGGGGDLTDNGLPLGVVRISFGACSRRADVDALVALLREYFTLDVQQACPYLTVAADLRRIVEGGSADVPNNVGTGQQPSSLLPLLRQTQKRPRRLAEICVYPIKSCAAFRPAQWQLGAHGDLAFDRIFAVVDVDSGRALTQKQCAGLSWVCPQLDLERRLMHLVDGRTKTSEPGTPPGVTVRLDWQAGVTPEHSALQADNRRYRVCGDHVLSGDCGDEVARWLEAVLQRPCRLVRSLQRGGASVRNENVAAESPLSTLVNSPDDTDEARQAACSRKSTDMVEGDFKNEAPLLVCHRNSLEVLNAKATSASPMDRFRPNLVIEGGWPWEEDEWRRLALSRAPRVGAAETHEDLGEADLQLIVGKACRRCQMVCVDQSTGERSKEPLAVLSKWRRREGGTYFGVYARIEAGAAGGTTSDRLLRVGDQVWVVE